MFFFYSKTIILASMRELNRDQSPRLNYVAGHFSYPLIAKNCNIVHTKETPSSYNVLLRHSQNKNTWHILGAQQPCPKWLLKLFDQSSQFFHCHFGQYLLRQYCRLHLIYCTMFLFFWAFQISANSSCKTNEISSAVRQYRHRS